MYIIMYIYFYTWVTHFNTSLVLHRLGLAEGCASPSLQIGDDPNLCMALKWRSYFVRYSQIYLTSYAYVCIYTYIYIYIYSFTF